jgi:valyl-tRNA synthetase
MNIKAGENVPLLISAPEESQRVVFRASADQIARLARTSEVSVGSELNAPAASARAVLAGGAEVAIPLEGLIDFEQERQRLGKELEKLSAEATKLQAQLGNAQFVERAPAEKVNELRARLADINQRTVAIEEMLKALA